MGSSDPLGFTDSITGMVYAFPMIMFIGATLLFLAFMFSSRYRVVSLVGFLLLFIVAINPDWPYRERFVGLVGQLIGHKY